jgi:long-chain fatty acid transport protein
MRKLLTLITALFIAGNIFAGGLVTNSNQSAMFTRLQNRNASTGIDAVYYNPAGLTRLNNGLYVSVNNQVIQQTKTIGNYYKYLSGTDAGNKSKDYIGKINVPVFPGIYAAYKTGKLAFSLGFNPVGGGGGATYDSGLPSFEMSLSDLVPALSGMGLPTSQYAADIYFEGTSVYFGYQANVSYQVTDMISAAIGVRVISAKNTYNGHISDIMINPMHPLVNPSAAMVSAPAFFTTIGQAAYATKTANREVDAEQTGSGLTPVLSVNIAPSEKLNIAAKYEFKTCMELTTKVNGNKSGGIFTDGSKTVADMPAVFTLGAEYKPIDKLMVAVNLTSYFDKNVDYDGSKTIDVKMIDNNFLEYGIGTEYSINDKLRASIGWTSTSTGVNSNYQNDQRYSTNTNSFGAGIGYKITPNIDLNIGGQYTAYASDSKIITHNFTDNPLMPITTKETYNKKTWIAGIGLDFYFGK